MLIPMVLMDLMQRTLLTAMGALTLFYAFLAFRLGYWKRRGILHHKSRYVRGVIQSVLVGRSRQHVSGPLQTVYETYKNRAPFVGCFVLLKPFVMVLDLELVRNVLLTDDGSFTSRGLYHNVGAEPLSGNLLQLDGCKWRKLHSQSSSVFTPSNIDKLLPKLLEVANIFKRHIGEEKIKKINVSQLVESYNVEMIASLAYGLNGQDLSQFRDMSRNYWSNWSLWRAFLSLEFPLLARMLRQKSYAEFATNYFLKLTLTQLEQERRRDRHPLQNFMQLYSRTEPSLTDKQIAAQAFGFILAGLTPLNGTLGFCLFELALQPELQQRVRAEIKKTLQKHGGHLTVDSLKELSYTKQVLNETLRLHTPYPFLLRRATKEFEMQYAVFVIARGNNLIIPTAAIHRDPEIYNDPHRFDPDRFEAKAVGARPAMSFLPFGDGLRGCIAKQLAQQQLLIGLVTLLQHHQYAPCAETERTMQYDHSKLLLMPKSEIQLSVERVD